MEVIEGIIIFLLTVVVVLVYILVTFCCEAKKSDLAKLSTHVAFIPECKVPKLEHVKSDLWRRGLMRMQAVLEETPATHPYKNRLANFAPNFSEFPFLGRVDLRPLNETPLEVVANKDDLDRLLELLRKEKIIGVDVKYSRSRAAAVLVQISTSSVDIIVDAIGLRDDMHLLGEIFLNPAILKVFHACHRDAMRYLQKDFGLFFINIFDTQMAMEALDYEDVFLVSVLFNKYFICKNQLLQGADFGTRPLPQYLMDDAKLDTHFLIDLFFELKDEFEDDNSLRLVLLHCHNICKILHTN